MTDYHLNLFYTYNRDNQLIENNLTRAWIVTLGLVSAGVRDGWLRLLLKEPFAAIGEDVASFPAFDGAQLALQNRIDRKRTQSSRRKYVLTIAGDALDMVNAEDNPYLSVPDGWIYDADAEYCILVEAKLHGNPLQQEQVVAHAKTWLCISSSDLPRHLLAISWLDVANSIQQVQNGALSHVLLNEQESRILTHLLDYLGFFGYRPLTGFNFSGLGKVPAFAISGMGLPGLRLFQQLGAPPAFRIGTT